MTRTLHHLALGSPDPDGLARFYRDVLGLDEVKRHDDEGEVRSVWLRLSEGAVLMIERIPAGDRVDEAPMRPGLFLLAVGIDDGERDEVEARLEEAGCAVETRSEFSSYARDPEGNRIAISSYPLER